MEIYLIRHPAVAIPPGICYGHSDIALAGPVDDLANRLRRKLPEQATIVSSPLTRCRLLAQALGSAVFDERLREINFGEWEMRTYDSIGRPAIDAWAADMLHFRPPGGETAEEMATRACAALAHWCAEAPTALVIVSHGGPLRAIAGALQRLAPAQWLTLPFGHGELWHIDGTSGGARVI